VSFAFGGVMFREILMDVNDAAGDAAAGVVTLPVLLGRRGAVGAALACLLSGAAVAAARLAGGGSAAAFGDGGLATLLSALLPHGAVLPSALASAAAAAPLAVLALAVGNLATLAGRVARSGYAHDAVDRAVSECLKPIGWGIVLLAALG
jgi:4-hydroxybenzoate polyprenyltransferase